MAINQVLRRVLAVLALLAGVAFAAEHLRAPTLKQRVEKIRSLPPFTEVSSAEKATY